MVRIVQNLYLFFPIGAGMRGRATWGAVWPLAIAGLGRFTKTGSSILVMAIDGGAILPLCFGWLKDVLGNIQQAYWIFVPALLFIVFYAFKGYKIGVNKSIKLP